MVENQPGDKVAQRMLVALQPKVDAPPPPPSSAVTESGEVEPADGTDLVGTWRAERDGDAFELTVDENAQFVWKVTPKSGQAVEISGPLAATKDTLVLESEDQGTMVAKVTSVGADEFQFVVSGGPPDDKGLVFKRVTPAQ